MGWGNGMGGRDGVIWDGKMWDGKMWDGMGLEGMGRDRKGREGKELLSILELILTAPAYFDRAWLCPPCG